MYKVLIRPLTIEDASTSYHWRNDGEVWKYTGNRPNIHITEEVEKNWIVDKLSETNSKRFAIEVDNIYVGNIQLTSITKSDAEFHIFIGNKDYWGKGVAYSAIQQILRYAEYILKLDKVYLKVNPEHEKAIKLYERCGFIKIDNNVSMEINLKDRNKPLVSIFSMVFNHAPFLEKCLDSFLMQKCLFDFEIVIGEDFSKDNSREILQRYQNKYPGKFKLLLHEKNIGAVNNQNETLKACDGKYIALCEGDDYWTDPYKLQKQVDFLEANTDYSGCFCNTQYVDSEGKEIGVCKRVPEGMVKISFEEMVQRFMLHTPSFIFRRSILNNQILTFIGTTPAGDLPLTLQCCLYGNIGFINENMVAYRTNVGIMRGWDNYQGFLNKIDILEKFKKEFNLNKYQNAALNWSIAYNCLKLAKNFAINKEKLKSIKYYLQFLRNFPYCFLLNGVRIETTTTRDILRPLFFLIKY
jgi:RimJ/RimL family protein N-acetyltransferase/glycosyltransferase involved in cell wall biosynthesis